MITASIEQYLITALWSSTGDDGEPLDDKYSIADFPESEIEKAERDYYSFLEKAGAVLDDYNHNQIAHYFWLTRNGHGTGFWDGDYPKELGEFLTKLSEEFGEVVLYVGDDGKLYFSR